MLYEVDWAEDGTYRPDEYNSPEKFFNDCLENSTEFDLQLGYFSSATISVLADGFASFIANGGKMRLVINHIVSDEDKNAISKGIHGGVIDCFDLENFEELRKTFDEYQQQFFDCLAFLIYDKRIDIRIIKPRNKKGIAHTKSGQFRDGDSVTSFTGSANFTISGLFNNLEEIKIDRSDSIDKMVQNRIASQREEFDSIMKGKKTNIIYLEPDELISAITADFGDKDIEELLNVEKKLRKIKKEKSFKDSQNRFVQEDVINIEPKFPYPSGPREYQQTAYDNWIANKKKGFFAMATGTGKTITSLNCLYNNYKQKGSYKALILVPTIALVEQWQKECLKFNFRNIVKISSKSQWKDYLSDIITTCMFDSDNQSYIILATYASFVKSNVYNRLFDLPEETLLIADEAHNMGSASIIKIMSSIPFMERIGLSATPNRKYDEDGNKAINMFFGIVSEYTFEYTMKEAISKDVLCNYRYFPKIVHLTDEEMDEYKSISLQIAKFFDPETKKLKDNPILTALLLKRKRIIHKAQNKLKLFESIITDIYKNRGSLQYTMVYVPEGVSNHDEEFNFATVSDSDDEAYSETLIDKYSSIVAKTSPTMTVEQFTSKEKDRNDILRRFASGKTQVLTAMKCLDEGVDVPRAEYAIFCASTGNPRQFIQRRGRILRNHKDKTIAYIYDMVVVPKTDRASSNFELERSLIKHELERVFDFASLATNKSYTNKELESTLDYYQLNLNGDEN